MSFWEMVKQVLREIFKIPEPEGVDRKKGRFEVDHEAGPKFDRWIDYAIDGPQMKRRGKYKTRTGFPDGLIVHYAVNSGSAVSMMKYGAGAGLTYMGLEKDGTLYQGNPLDSWGYHAGKSSMTYKGRSVTSVSRYCVGLEVCGAGKLFGVRNGKKAYIDTAFEIENYKGEYHPDWDFDKSGNLRKRHHAIPKSRIRFIKKKDSNRAVGAYEKFTLEQEKAIVKLVRWLQGVNPDFNLDLVLGHDEVSPGRKTDPGGALSVSMEELRKKLKEYDV